jgi:hypothetical protein
LLKALTKKESSGEAFAHTVAIALDRLPPKKQIEAQIKIQTVLLEYVEDN